MISGQLVLRSIFLVHRLTQLCFRGNYNSKTFMMPVIAFTVLYNLPKFFELYVEKTLVTKNLTCYEILATPFYKEHHGNCTLNETGIVNVPEFDAELNLKHQVKIAATNLRTNSVYIRVYILWFNLIVQVHFSGA